MAAIKALDSTTLDTMRSIRHRIRSNGTSLRTWWTKSKPTISVNSSSRRITSFWFITFSFIIAYFVRHLSSVPHLAGTAQDLEQAQWLADNFLQFGLDEAVVIPYTVLLSYPDMEKPNKVYLLDDKSNVNFTTSGKQTPLLRPEENSPLVAPNFNAYSGTGTANSVRHYIILEK